MCLYLIDQLEAGIAQSRSIRFSWTLGPRVYLVNKKEKKKKQKEKRIRPKVAVTQRET